MTLTAEDKLPAHKIITESIAGAGASSVGIAGSVAVAVVNGATKAYIAAADGSLYPIVVVQETTIKAYARQVEETTASASVGANGRAEKNKEAGAYDATAGSATNSKTVTATNTEITVYPNGNATITDHTVNVAAEDGYKLSVSGTNLINYTYYKTGDTDTATGSGTVAVTDLGSGAYRFTTASPTDLKSGALVHYDLTFVGALNVTVANSTNGTVTADTENAAELDRIEVTVTAADGYELDTLTFKKAGSTTSTNITTKELSDPTGKTYLFTMPDGNVTVTATFKLKATSTDTNTTPTNTTNTNSKGKTVGVGAAFSLTLSGMDVEAGVGAGRNVTSGSFDLRAEADHECETISVAGSDPLTSGNASASTSTDTDSSGAKDISLDASAAVTIINNDVFAYVAEGATVITTGGNDVTVVADDTATTETDESEFANFYILAQQKGDTLSKASSFAIGKSTAVGAAVTVNIVDSDVLANFLGTGIASGVAKIVAYTYNEDDSEALATAMGADMQRYLDKFAKGVKATEDTANKLLSGDYFSGGSTTSTKTNSNNGTANTINGSLSSNSNNEQTGTNTPETGNSNSLSTNVLRSQNTTVQGSGTTDPTVNQGVTTTNNNTGTIPVTNTNNNNTPSQSYQVAAAVGLNITAHKALVTVMGSLTAASITILADNDGNFKTLGTGAAMSLANNSNSIALGIAISVNRNEAQATVTGTLISVGTDTGLPYNNGDITVTAELTQNMDGDYAGLLAAQSLAGAVTGSGGNMSIAGALSIAVTRAKTAVIIGSGSNLDGGNITLSASDKSKIAIRAGGVSISKGTAVGIGASFAFIYSHNEVTVSVGDGTTVTGTNLVISAEKKRVDINDYTNTVGLSKFLTDSSNLSADEKEDADLGIVNIEKDDATDSYKVEIKVTTDDVLEMVNLLNFLSSTNYYAEAIAGSIMGSGGSKQSSASLAGAFAMVFFYNTVSALVGENVHINLRGDMSVTAQNDANVRIIAGALSVAPSKVGVGLNLAFMRNNDEVTAQIASGTSITTGGKYTQLATGASDIMVITVAASISTKSTSTFTLGGSINALAPENTIKCIVADGVTIAAGGDVSIGSEMDQFLLLVSVSVAATAGKAAVGGTLAVIVNQAKALTEVGNATITSLVMSGSTPVGGGSIDIYARSKELMVNVLASASAASSSSNVSVAGTLGVLITLTEAKTSVADGATICAYNDLSVRALSDSKLVIVAVAVSVGGSSAAVGATITVNVFSRQAKATVGDNTTLTAEQGTILIEALANDSNIIVALAAGASKGQGIAGTIPVVVSLNDVEAIVGNGATLTAGDSIGVQANLSTGSYIIAGALGLSSGGSGIGATISTAVFSNIVKALVGDNAVLTALGHVTSGQMTDVGVQLRNRDERRRGVVIAATANEMVLMISISGAASTGSAAVAGVISTLVMKNVVMAKAGNNDEIRAEGTSGTYVAEGGGTETLESGVLIEADDDSCIIDVAGGLAVSGGSAGVGATVVVLVFNKTVLADAGAVKAMSASGDIDVTANNEDDVWLLALAFGASSSVGVAGDVNVLVFNSSVEAYLGGETISTGRDVNVTAKNDATLINIGAGIGGGSSTGVVAVGIVTYYYNKTSAALTNRTTGSRTNVTAGRNVLVCANSKEIISADAAGIGIGGSAGVSGTLDILVLMIQTKAWTDDRVTIHASGNVDVLAVDNYTVIALVVNVAGGGSAGVAITALVSVSLNTIAASVGKSNVITAAGTITVKASSNRIIESFTASAAVGGAAGVVVSLTVVVAGSAMSQDAHDAIYAETDDQATASDIDGNEYNMNTDEDGALLYERGGLYYRIDSQTGVASQTDYTGTVTPYNHKAMDPQAQVDGGFSAGNQSALAGQKPDDSLDDLLAGDGQGTEELSSGYDTYGQDLYEHYQVTETDLSNNEYKVYEDEDGELIYELAIDTGSGTSYEYYRKVGGAMVLDTDYQGQKTAVYVQETTSTDLGEMKLYTDENNQFIYKDASGNLYYKVNGVMTATAYAGALFEVAATVKDEYGNPVQKSSDSDAGTSGMNDGQYNETANTTLSASTLTNGGSGASYFDATTAIVQSGSTLTAGGDINVLANDKLNTDTIVGSLAIGGSAGVGVGIAVAILFSNVLAMVEGGTTLSAGGHVKVEAKAGADTSKTVDDVNQEREGTDSLMDDVLDKVGITASTIRLISVMVSGGTVGVGVSAAILLVFSDVEAILAGNVTNATTVMVDAGMNYGDVLAMNTALSAGGVAVNVSGAFVYFGGKTVACIAGDAQIGTSSNPLGNVIVTTSGSTQATVAVVALAAGGVAVGVNIAFAVSTNRIDTFIGQGVTVYAGSVLVDSDFTTNTTGLIFAITAGGVAVGVSVVVAIGYTLSQSYLGVTPYTSFISGEADGCRGSGVGSIHANSVTVKNYIHGDVTIVAIAASGGGVSVNVGVALALNRVSGYAAINQINVYANTIVVTAIMDGDTKNFATSVSVGGVGVGVIVALSQIWTTNKAVIDTTGVTVQATSIFVNAGTVATPSDSQALTVVIAGVAGAVGVGVNFAIAINAAENYALITGSGILNAGGVSIYANGNTRAYGIITSAAVGAVAVNVNFVASVLISIQKASVEGSGQIAIGNDLTVQSDQNYNPPALGIFELITGSDNSYNSDRDQLVSFTTMAQAFMFTAGGGAISVTANIALANANATGRAVVAAGNLTVGNNLSVISNGRSTADITIMNLNVAAIGVSLLAGFAYTRGTFEAVLDSDVSSGEIAVTGNITVTTNYIATAVTDFTPAAGGVSAGFVTASVNLGVASVRTIAKATIKGSGRVEASEIAVSALGDVKAQAIVRTPRLAVGAAVIAANVAVATLRADQTASIQGVTVLAGKVSVTSVFNEDGGEGSGAVAEIGRPDKYLELLGLAEMPSASVAMLNLTANSATAVSNMTSRAIISGASFINGTGNIAVRATGTSMADANVIQTSTSGSSPWASR